MKAAVCRFCGRREAHGHTLTEPDGSKVKVWFQPRRWA